jgi:hypothetical protein
MSDHDHHHHHHSHAGETHPHQLEPPHEVFHDPKAGEVARVWISNGGLSLALHAMAFGNPETWGHVLAGIAQQVAASAEEMGHGKAAANFEAIRKVLNEDMGKAAGQFSALANKS